MTKTKTTQPQTFDEKVAAMHKAGRRQVIFEWIALPLGLLSWGTLFVLSLLLATGAVEWNGDQAALFGFMISLSGLQVIWYPIVAGWFNGKSEAAVVAFSDHAQKLGIDPVDYLKESLK